MLILYEYNILHTGNKQRCVCLQGNALDRDYNQEIFNNNVLSIKNALSNIRAGVMSGL